MRIPSDQLPPLDLGYKLLDSWESYLQRPESTQLDTTSTMSQNLKVHIITPERHFILRPAPHESSEGRRTMGTYQNTPRLYIGALSTTGNEEIITHYESIRVHLDAAMQQQNLLEGGMITLVSLNSEKGAFDQGEYASVPTVLILCKNPTTMVEAVSTIPSNLRMEIIDGGVDFLLAPSLTAQQVNTMEKPNMGASIGVAGVPKSATLGGYVRGTVSGKIYGITNGHVALMGGEGYTMPHLIRNTEGGIAIVQCSEQDHANALEAQQKTVDAATEEDAVYGGLRGIEARIKASALAAMERLNTGSRLFGKVRCAHFGVIDFPDDLSWLDIALVEVDPAQIGKNIFGKTLFEKDGTVTGRVVEMKEGLDVTKAGGRTTGTTHGIVNGVLADVYTTATIASPQVTMITREWVVISQSGSQYAVSAKGDSGSLFVAQRHAGGTQFYDVVAQLFSGGIRRSNTANRTSELANAEISVVTSAKRILEWLRQEMGEDMEFVSGI